MAASAVAIAHQLQALIEHVNSLNAHADAANERHVDMADYLRMQPSMDETLDKLGAVIAQIEADGGGTGGGLGCHDALSRPETNQKELRVDTWTASTTTRGCPATSSGRPSRTPIA